MKSTSELTDFYYNELFPELEKLEDERKALVSKITTYGIGLAAITAGIDLSIFFKFGFNNFLVALPILAAILAGWVYKHMSKDYIKSFKTEIIKRLIHAISENLSYMQFQHISQYHYKRSNIFKDRIDRYNGNDLVKGDFNDTLLQFSDLHSEYVTKDSKGNKHWHTTFKGLFITAEFNKHFDGKTIILPDQAEQMFGSLIGGWLQSNNFSQRELIKMDNPEFEKHFVVYGTDQIEARYLLTHSMMERLLNLHKRTKGNLYISFIGGQIYIAINNGHDHFEPTVFKSLLKYKLVMEYVNTLNLAIGIVEELKLNEKLWSKQKRSDMDEVLHTHDALFGHEHLNKRSFF
ncbi:MAG: Galanin [Epsilonproteobacteria bacterium]|nr:MAG: Galanin [Campylobacterota bacterium]